MKKETLKRIKYYIEIKKDIEDRHINKLLMIGKTLDSKEAIDAFVELYNIDDNQTTEYYIANVYSKLYGSGKEIDSPKEYLLQKDILEFIATNSFKNRLVSTHSFHSAYRDSIEKNGLLVNRGHNKSIERLIEYGKKIIGFDPCVYYNTSKDSISALLISKGTHSICHYGKASPEWFQQYLEFVFNISLEEYSSDPGVCWDKVSSKYKEIKNKLSTEEFEDFVAIFSNYFMRLVSNKQNPCIAIINKESSLNNDIFNIPREDLLSLSIGFGNREIAFEEDIKPEDLIIAELPIYKSVNKEKENTHTIKQ